MRTCARAGRATRRPAPAPGRVTLTVETRPALPSDRFLESLGLRGAMRRKGPQGPEAARTILEEGKGRGARATIAGPPKASACAQRGT